ncbi:MAG: ankyrin repeat domain-containing protein [Myxococcales bacterium]|nr:ankyrin repeat domain-containing protein [Myxococcales bacterium]
MLDRIKAGRTVLIFEHVAAGGAATAATGINAHGVSLLQWAAYYGDVSAIRFLIGQGARVQELGDDLGLICAAFHGHWRLVEFLLKQGADPNHALADTGETALHAALCKPNRPAYDLVVEVLLARGADANRKTTPAVTAASSCATARRKARRRSIVPRRSGAKRRSRGSDARSTYDSSAGPRFAHAGGDSRRRLRRDAPEFELAAGRTPLGRESRCRLLTIALQHPIEQDVVGGHPDAGHSRDQQPAHAESAVLGEHLVGAFGHLHHDHGRRDR